MSPPEGSGTSALGLYRVFFEDFIAQRHALVADVHPARPRDQVLHLLAALAAEGTFVVGRRTAGKRPAQVVSLLTVSLWHPRRSFLDVAVWGSRSLQYTPLWEG